MRYAVILAGGSGTRLWPWSREGKPKQLLPMVHGASLLRLAYERLDGLVPRERRLVCANVALREAITSAIGDLPEEQFFGEPAGRDTAAAIGFCAATLLRRDPDAVMAICTADHIIEPHDHFTRTMAQAFALAERSPGVLVTFGVSPTGPSTAYGYLELGEPLDGAMTVRSFREKPDAAKAELYSDAGPQKYLWNSGMFVWKAATLLDSLRIYQPRLHQVVQEIADAYDTPHRESVVNRLYPTLEKISIDYAVMEPASHDVRVKLLAIPLSSHWLDVGSWNAYAEVCDHVGSNAVAAERHVVIDCDRVLVASDDPHHLVTAIGCEDLVIVHTSDATLVCRADRAEAVKQLNLTVKEKFGGTYL